MGVEVEEVEGDRALKTFVDFAYELYAGHPCWVPPLRFDELNTLRRDKNPAFECCDAKYWLARRDGKIVGRVAGIVNRRYIQKWGNPYARFGWLDFVDDEAVCRALLGAVEAWARQNGLTAVHGPLGFTDLDREGMLVEGFAERGTLATNYNHPYYPVHVEALGYVKDADWVEFQLKTPGRSRRRSCASPRSRRDDCGSASSSRGRRRTCCRTPRECSASSTRRTGTSTAWCH